MESIVTRFYRGQSTDNRGRTLDGMLTWDARRLEDSHDYIQWLFPLRERSMFNPDAPLVTDGDAAAFAGDPALRQKLLKAFARMLEFYGFACQPEGTRVSVVRTPRFPHHARNWLTSGNHNFLRITRILTSLRLLGCPDHAAAFLAALEDVYLQYPRVIGKQTLAFWRNALA